LAKERQVIESYRRVLAFLEANPAPEPATYAGQRDVLKDVIARITDHSSAQVFGTQLVRAEKKKQTALLQTLYEKHMRPIVAIGKAEMADTPGIQEALRIPHFKVGVLKTLAAAGALRDAAALYQPAFVRNGRPEDFIAQLTAAMEAVEKTTSVHAVNVGTRVGARAGIRKELRRGRGALAVLDSIVKATFVGNDVVLAKWRIAKRIRGLPSGGSEAEAVTPLPPVSTPTSTAA
jgi:hypothetical protein